MNSTLGIERHLLFLTAFWLSTAHSTSFECSKAKSIPEQLICSTPELSKADDELNIIFEKARAQSTDKQLFKEWARQRWNNRERNCRDVACIRSWYADQINFYSELLGDNLLPQPTHKYFTNQSKPSHDFFENPLLLWGTSGIGLYIFTLSMRGLLNRRNEKKKREALARDIARFQTELSKHLPALSRNRAVKIMADEYGFKDFSRWEKEKISFLKKLSFNSKPSNGYYELNLDAQSSILEECISNYNKKTPVQLNSKYIETMTGLEYEHFCAEQLRENGWKARVTSASGDQGVDIIAETDGYKVALQCKKYASPVGNSAVQEVSSGVQYWGANLGVVVTNNTYTRSALELANVQGVILIHHDQLDRLKDLIKTRL